MHSITRIALEVVRWSVSLSYADRFIMRVATLKNERMTLSLSEV